MNDTEVFHIKLLKIIVIILALFVLSLYIKYQQLLNPDSDTKIAETPTTKPTVSIITVVPSSTPVTAKNTVTTQNGISTFKNITNNYSFNFPQDWLSYDQTPDYVSIRSQFKKGEEIISNDLYGISTDNVFIEIHTVKDLTYSFDTWVKQMSDPKSLTSISALESVKLGNLNGYKYSWTFGASSGVSYLLDRKNQYIFINIQPSNTKLIDELNLFLSSLKFN